MPTVGSGVATSPVAGHQPPAPEPQRGRNGRTLLVLRATSGPFNTVGGLFTVLMCADCLATRGHGAGPYPVMTRAEMRAGLDLLPTWALEQKAAANRQVIASCANGWPLVSRWRGCTRSRGWPG